MTKLGLDLSARKLVIVKSTQHFQAGFAPFAKAILYAAPPGALRSDFRGDPVHQTQDTLLAACPKPVCKLRGRARIGESLSHPR